MELVSSLLFFLNKDCDSLYGYLSDKGKIWDGGNDFHNMLYDLRISNTMLDNNNLYAIVFLALDGDIIKIIGAKQALKPDIPVTRPCARRIWGRGDTHAAHLPNEREVSPMDC